MQQTINNDQGQITGMCIRLVVKSGHKYIYSHTVFTLYHDEILTTSLKQITPLY